MVAQTNRILQNTSAKTGRAGIFFARKDSTAYSSASTEQQGRKVRHVEVLITKCPIRNLFAKKVLMLYNEVDLKCS